MHSLRASRRRLFLAVWLCLFLSSEYAISGSAHAISDAGFTQSSFLQLSLKSQAGARLALGTATGTGTKLGIGVQYSKIVRPINQISLALMMMIFSMTLIVPVNDHGMKETCGILISVLYIVTAVATARFFFVNLWFFDLVFNLNSLGLGSAVLEVKAADVTQRRETLNTSSTILFISSILYAVLGEVCSVGNRDDCSWKKARFSTLYLPVLALFMTGMMGTLLTHQKSILKVENTKEEHHADDSAEFKGAVHDITKAYSQREQSKLNDDHEHEKKARLEKAQLYQKIGDMMVVKQGMSISKIDPSESRSSRGGNATVDLNGISYVKNPSILIQNNTLSTVSLVVLFCLVAHGILVCT